jgi:hypothetical protein
MHDTRVTFEMNPNHVVQKLTNRSSSEERSTKPRRRRQEPPRIIL